MVTVWHMCVFECMCVCFGGVMESPSHAFVLRQVVLKRAYNNSLRSERKLLSGNDW